MSAPPAGPEAAVSVRDLTVAYDDVLALDSASVEVAPGQICGVVGTNGSGKSTLFRAITGMVAARRGEVRLHGLVPARARRRGLVGYVPQSEQVDWNFPVRVVDVVMMGRYGHMGITRRPRPADRVAVAEALERTDLTALAQRQIGALSGGQRKRAFVARGLAQDAAVFLLDEPFAGVDKRSEATIMGVLREIRDAGRTVLISTHDLASVPDLCDRVVLLQQRVVAQGAPHLVLTPERLRRAFGVATAQPRFEGTQ